jgi:hypothetical protein
MVDILKTLNEKTKYIMFHLQVVITQIFVLEKL